MKDGRRRAEKRQCSPSTASACWRIAPAFPLPPSSPPRTLPSPRPSSRAPRPAGWRRAASGCVARRPDVDARVRDAIGMSSWVRGRSRRSLSDAYRAQSLRGPMTCCSVARVATWARDLSRKRDRRMQLGEERSRIHDGDRLAPLTPRAPSRRRWREPWPTGARGAPATPRGGEGGTGAAAARGRAGPRGPSPPPPAFLTTRAMRVPRRGQCELPSRIRQGILGAMPPVRGARDRFWFSPTLRRAAEGGGGRRRGCMAGSGRATRLEVGRRGGCSLPHFLGASLLSERMLSRPFLLCFFFFCIVFLSGVESIGAPPERNERGAAEVAAGRGGGGARAATEREQRETRRTWPGGLSGAAQRRHEHRRHASASDTAHTHRGRGRRGKQRRMKRQQE